MTLNLRNILKGKVVIIGVGNVLRGDDGFGPALIERLQGKISAVCLDAGTAPESYVGRMVKENPDTILFVDAAHLGRGPGSWDILEKSEIMKSGLTTHDLSPALLIQFLEQEAPRAAIYLLGIQPVVMSIGSEMSEIVQRALENIEKEIKEALHA